jgi:hypothetical protein
MTKKNWYELNYQTRDPDQEIKITLYKINKKITWVIESKSK